MKTNYEWGRKSDFPTAIYHLDVSICGPSNLWNHEEKQTQTSSLQLLRNGIYTESEDNRDKRCLPGSPAWENIGHNHTESYSEGGGWGCDKVSRNWRYADGGNSARKMRKYLLKHTGLWKNDDYLEYDRAWPQKVHTSHSGIKTALADEQQRSWPPETYCFSHYHTQAWPCRTETARGSETKAHYSSLIKTSSPLRSITLNSMFVCKVLISPCTFFVIK